MTDDVSIHAVQPGYDKVLRFHWALAALKGMFRNDQAIWDK
jgi:hypothetical protein